MPLGTQRLLTQWVERACMGKRNEFRHVQANHHDLARANAAALGFTATRTVQGDSFFGSSTFDRALNKSPLLGRAAG